MENSELEALQNTYKQSVNEWVNSIRAEESLASKADFSEVSLDEWEQARRKQEQMGEQVQTARKGYEDGLRKTFFNF